MSVSTRSIPVHKPKENIVITMAADNNMCIKLHVDDGCGNGKLETVFGFNFREFSLFCFEWEKDFDFRDIMTF
jgi:hypothetical protein